MLKGHRPRVVYHLVYEDKRLEDISCVSNVSMHLSLSRSNGGSFSGQCRNQEAASGDPRKPGAATHKSAARKSLRRSDGAVSQLPAPPRQARARHAELSLRGIPRGKAPTKPHSGLREGISARNAPKIRHLIRRNPHMSLWYYVP